MRAPLRAMQGYSAFVLEKYGGLLGPEEPGIWNASAARANGWTR